MLRALRDLLACGRNHGAAGETYNTQTTLQPPVRASSTSPTPVNTRRVPRQVLAPRARQGPRPQPRNDMLLHLAEVNANMTLALRQSQELLSLACAQAFHLDVSSANRPHDTVVYVLRLHQNKYYVGKTQRLLHRFREHVAGDGAAWTRRYKPVRIEATYPCLVDGMENAVVKMYMMTKGVDNVRGGAYVTDVLSAEQIAFIQAELVHDADLCFRCHQKGHFVRDCQESKSGDSHDVQTDDDMRFF